MNQMSIVNPETVRRHLANNSTSKVAHQFPKSRRFQQPSPYCPVAFYSNTSTLSNRRVSLGSGKKSDFTKDLTASPPSTLYMHKSLFEENINKGRSFGQSRELSPDRSYLVPQLKKFPGPGNYENQIETRMATSYTMRSRTIDVIESNMSYKKAPGPGSYESVELGPKSGRFMVSKFGDSKLAKITNHAPRFPKQRELPGPLSYIESDSFSPRGKYVLSTRTGRGTRPFDKTARSSFTEEFVKIKRNPGPADYETPSEFGVYADSKYYKTLGSFKSTIDK